MDLSLFLRAIQGIGPVVAQVPAVASFIKQGISLLKDDDQPIAKEAYADLIADNDEGHARLQAKLAEAAKR